jgi:hypothetical protein
MTDVLDLLKRADPVDTNRLNAEEPPHEALLAILASPREAGAGSGEGRRPPAGRPRIGRPARRGRLLAPAVAAGLAAVIAIALLVSGGARPDEAAAAALRKVADVVRSQPAAGLPGAGEFLYTRVDARPLLAIGPERPFRREIHSASDFGFAVQVPQTNETWHGQDGGLIRQTVAEPRFPTPGDRRAWIEAGRPRLPGGDLFEDRFIGPIERISLPTDPDELLAELERDAADGDHGNGYIFTTLIADYLRELGTTPSQRAALYEVAARLPGIDLLGPRTDREGRSGTAFASDDDEGRHRVTLIIDPHTGDLLAKRTVTLPGGAIPAGTVMEDSVYSVPTIVGAIGERR